MACDPILVIPERKSLVWIYKLSVRSLLAPFHSFLSFERGTARMDIGDSVGSVLFLSHDPVHLCLSVSFLLCAAVTTSKTFLAARSRHPSERMVSARQILFRK